MKKVKSPTKKEIQPMKAIFELISKKENLNVIDLRTIINYI